MQTKNKIIRIADEKYLNEVLAGPLGDTVLEIEEGVYRLCRPLVLKDVQNFTLHGNGNVRLEGGERFRGGFKRAPQGENVFVKKLAAAPFGRLYADGKELVRARYPRRSRDLSKEVIRGRWDLDKELLTIPAEYLPMVESKTEIDALVAWIHCIDRRYEYTVEGDNIVISFEEEVRGRITELNRCMSLDYLDFYFAGSPAFLQEHGDWCYDAAAGELYVKWTQGSVNDAEFLRPELETLVRAENCGNVHFAGVEFAYANWAYPQTENIAGVQSTIYRAGGKLRRPAAAVSVVGCVSLHINNCKILDTAATALDIGPHCRNITFENSRIARAGGNGIMIGYFGEANEAVAKEGLPYLPENMSEVADNVRILRNEICGVGVCDNSGTGIAAGFCRNLYIEHNDIRDTSYSGIAAGWGWRENKPFSVITNFQIRNNRIENYLCSHFYDGAGIYILGGQSGEKNSVVAGNYIIGRSGLGVLYLDEGVSHCIVKNNVLQGDAVHGLLYCHDIGNDLHDITMTDNYAVRDYYRTDFHMDPAGPSQKERGVRCDGLKIFDPEHMTDAALRSIVAAAGRN